MVGITRARRPPGGTFGPSGLMLKLVLLNGVPCRGGVTITDDYEAALRKQIMLFP
jgi:hypothetical protein